MALAIITERAFASPLHPAQSASLRGCERHDLVRCKWQQPFSGGFRRGRVIWLCDWPRPLAVICFTQRQTRMKSSWKARASHPSKPCRVTSALAGCTYFAASQAALAQRSMAVLQVFQAKMLASEEAGLDVASLRDPRSATDLALRATKPPPKPSGVRCPAW